MKSSIAVVGVALVTALGAAHGQVRVGFITPMSGPAAVVGQDQMDGFNLGMEQLKGKLGGLNATILAEDDQAKPDLGNQIIMSNSVGLCGHVEIEDQAVLGGMLFYSGIDLVRPIQVKDKNDIFIFAVVISLSVALNPAVGFIAGVPLAFILKKNWLKV